MSIKKLFIGLVAVALVLSATVSIASADTITDLQNQIGALSVQLASLQGGASASTSVNVAPNQPLTIGSRGADVIALQNWLIGQSYQIPAGATGYFGTQTKAAVMAFQKAKNISPVSGYYGPITMQAVQAQLSANGTGSTGSTGTTGPLCPNGMTLASNCSLAPNAQAVPLCPNGMTLASNCATAPTGQTTSPVMDGTDGSLSVSYSSYAPSSQTIRKGDMGKAIIAVKLSASTGAVSVNRLDVDFSNKPYLYFGKITLKDDAGNILATKTLSGAGDVDEITVGSDYKVHFNNVNFKVDPITDKTLIVYVDALAASDKYSDQALYVGIPSGSIRTVNGLGYTDSLGISSGTGSGVTSSTGVTLTLSSTGSTGSLTTRVSPNSPLKRTIGVSPTAVTSDVVLGVFSLKTQNQNATINTLQFNVNSTSSVATSTLYNNIRLLDANDALIAGSNNPVAGNSTFTNLNLKLTKDVWTDIKLIADVPAGNGGQSASSTLVGAQTVGTDVNDNTLTVSAATNQTSTDNVYSYSGLNITAGPPVLSNCGNSFGGNATNPTMCDMTFTLTLTAAANNLSDIFISKAAGVVLATSTTIGGTDASGAVNATTTLTSISTAAIAGDTSVSYRVPSEGRTFVFQGSFGKGTASATAVHKFMINKIWFGSNSAAGATSTAASNASSYIDYGLDSVNISKTL